MANPDEVAAGRPVVLRGGTVLTMDDAHTILADADVLVTGDRIAAVILDATAHLTAELELQAKIADRDLAGVGSARDVERALQARISVRQQCRCADDYIVDSMRLQVGRVAHQGAVKTSLSHKVATRFLVRFNY